MPCVNMPYMCKVGHDLPINTPLYRLGMHQANRRDEKDECAFSKINFLKYAMLTARGFSVKF